jgi:hypothetical protein
MFSALAFGQAAKDMCLINKRTNQWLGFIASVTGKNSYIQFEFVTKNDKCPHKFLKVSKERIEFFLDSLNRIGWTKNIKYISAEQKYQPAIELVSIDFTRMIKTDSIFQFVYKISLTDIKANITQSQYDTLYGTEKKKIISAFDARDFKFDEIEIQKGTGIIFVGLMSDGILRPCEDKYYLRILAPWTRYYF